MDYINPWHRKWHRNLILETIRSLFSSGADVSYNALAKTNQALVSASNYHFGSYRRACMMAGLDYDAIAKKPKWTSAKVIDLVRQARESGEELNWRSISGRRDDLRRAAAAAVKKRLFGRWDDALFAAGQSPEDIRRYRRWTAEAVLTELRRRADAGEPLNSIAIQKQIPGLYSAATRHFKTYDNALAAAKIDPKNVRQRRSWTQKEIVKELKLVEREHGFISRSLLRREQPSLLRAARQQFEDLGEACATAGIRKFRKADPPVQGMLFVDLKPFDVQRKPRTKTDGELLLPHRPRTAKASAIWDTETPMLFAMAS